MSFFGDLGQWGSDLFTGRWMGGETNLAHDNWTPIATLAGAAATGGAAMSGLGGLGALGLGGEAAAAGGETAVAAGGAELGGGGIESVLAGADPQALLAYASDPSAMATAEPMSVASDFNALGATEAGGPGGWGSFGPQSGLNAIDQAFGPGGGISGGGGIPANFADPNAMTGGASFDAINNPLGYAPSGMGVNTAPEMTGAMPPPGGGGGAPGGAGFFDKFTSGIGNQITKNPLGALGAGIGAIGLGANLMHGNPASADENMLRNQAAGMNAQAGQLMQYLQNGTLPPGLQAKLDQDKRAARAGAIARAGKAGLGTDPKFNSALAQEFAAIDLAALATEGQLANDLLKTGLQELNYSGTDLAQLIKVQQQRDQATGQAIANFAAALGRAGASSSLKG